MLSDLLAAAALGRLLLSTPRAFPAVRHQVPLIRPKEGQADEAEERVSIDTIHTNNCSRSADCPAPMLKLPPFRSSWHLRVARYGLLLAFSFSPSPSASKYAEALHTCRN